MLSRLLDFQVTFTYILWTFVFTVSVHYFYHQTHHLNKGETMLFVLVLNTWHLLEVFIMTITPGALDKAISFNRTTFKCDPRKKMVDLLKWTEILSAGRDENVEENLIRNVWNTEPILRCQSTSDKGMPPCFLSCPDWHLRRSWFSHLLLHAPLGTFFPSRAFQSKWLIHLKIWVSCLRYPEMSPSDELLLF